MKKSFIAAGILFAINVAVTVAFISMMPDQIPVHFTGGEVDRIGSKYENLTMVALAFASGLFLMLLTKFGDQDNRKTMARLNVGMQAIFIAMTVFVSLNVLSYDSSAIAIGESDAGISKISAIILGAVLLFLGNLMPKSTRNAAFGLRVPWTQKSDEAWRKGQRFGAYTSIPAGILSIVCGIVLDGDPAFTLTIVIFAIWTIVSIVGSYFVCKDVQG